MMKHTIESFSKDLFQQLMINLDVIISENDDQLVRASKSMNAIKYLLETLRTFVVSNDFKDQSEEIKFFKEIKPRFLSRFLFHQKVFALKLNEPFGDASQVLEYYKMQLTNIEDYFKQHKEFYSYHISGSSDLDARYFTRNSNSPLVNIDRTFSTGYDYMLAKLISCQLQKAHIIEYLLQPTRKDDTVKSKLAWTGPKNALVELIYGLHTVEAINHGKANVNQIAELFEEVFNVRLGNYYRVLQDIRLRKGNQSVFLDELKAKFIQRLDNISQ